MKHLAILFIGLLTLGGSTYAAEENTILRRGNTYDGSKYIFVENGIEFSVFPDGEFDFFIPTYVEGVRVGINAGPVAISFNTGFDYDPYVQYDEFGAVIQIENTPLFYDYYGRLIQAGDVRINYNRNRIARVGGLRIFYNNLGGFSHYTGFINVYNRRYVFHPYHNFYYRPLFDRCLVFTTPYRQFYNPIRYDYAFHRNNYFRGYNNGYSDGYANARRHFRRPNTGRVAHNNGRRANVDRNNARFRSATPSRKYNNVANRSRVRNNTTSRGIAQNARSRERTTDQTTRTRTQRVIAQSNNRGNGRSTTNSRGIINTRNTDRNKPQASSSTTRRTTTNSRKATVKRSSSTVRSNNRTAKRPSKNRTVRAQKSTTTRKVKQQKPSRSNTRASRSSSTKRSSSNARRG